MSDKDKIEKLWAAKDSAWREYDKLRAPADEAYKKYEAADKAHKDAILYDKIRRKVVRDLIDAAAQ